MSRPQSDDLEDIRAAREARGPVLRKSPGPSAWFDIRKRGAGHWAFSLNRFTSLGLVFYLYLHLAVLSMLLRGEEPGTASSSSRRRRCSSGSTCC